MRACRRSPELGSTELGSTEIPRGMIGRRAEAPPPGGLPLLASVMEGGRRLARGDADDLAAWCFAGPCGAGVPGLVGLLVTMVLVQKVRHRND